MGNWRDAKCSVAEARGWPQPSYATASGVAKTLEPGLVTLAHDGPERYATSTSCCIDVRRAGPNEMWHADHPPLDLWVVDEHGRPARPRLAVVLDDCSRAVAG